MCSRVRWGVDRLGCKRRERTSELGSPSGGGDRDVGGCEEIDQSHCGM